MTYERYLSFNATCAWYKNLREHCSVGGGASNNIFSWVYIVQNCTAAFNVTVCKYREVHTYRRPEKSGACPRCTQHAVVGFTAAVSNYAHWHIRNAIEAVGSQVAAVLRWPGLGPEGDLLDVESRSIRWHGTYNTVVTTLSIHQAHFVTSTVST